MTSIDKAFEKMDQAIDDLKRAVDNLTKLNKEVKDFKNTVKTTEFP